MRNSIKKTLIILIILAVSATGVFAQSRVGEPDPSQIGVDTAQQELREISISKFEDAGMWRSQMPRDAGITSVRKIKGSPLDKEPIEGEEEVGIQEADDYVLGVRANFYKRSVTSFSILPSKPMAVEGICKTVSVWVIGRNTDHMLKLLIKDQFGNRAEVTMGKLNFAGWKKMTVAIPTHIVQKDYHYANKMGIEILGFRVDCDPAETYGAYYIYFDDLRATTDLFTENNRDVDDIADVW
ncbi:MAG: flagellar filament outer layer protein FlaA [Spirochaetales bacterium]|uniref:Flagellar filament outer layer protein FlaA n=1 Tax=Candidatus Thalassospirochaeta sargassi TaxID=3119039 RepID=A0AAJ1IEZ5_9SPIO|nr:flagellar filament outer layer protein FlaA [Spirochaetales bacterium]